MAVMSFISCFKRRRAGHLAKIVDRDRKRNPAEPRDRAEKTRKQ